MFSTLKNYVTSWQQEELTFSYQLICSVTPAGLRLTLHQRQTEFSLTIIVQPSPDSLRVSGFNLIQEPWFKKLCQPLHNAALTEIALQALNLIVFCAECLGKEDINFMLSLKDAAHLTAFQALFTSISSHITLQGKRQLLTLSLWSSYPQGFFEKVKIMKMQLHQKLWASQKSDAFLRQYLQDSERLTTPLLRLLLTPEKGGTQGERGNVILFPITSSQRTATKSI
ncbi:MAG: hypothetical protein K0M45_02990 [Candidatus Paracaedibacteraceae bacterium]|nr:hypothetical protein [Candidatus Paracaedibacteraceae bacterium]